MRSIVLKLNLLLSVALLSSGCAHLQSHKSAYDKIGGQTAINAIADAFIEQIEFDREIFPYFAESNVDRFREKFSEHLCASTGGPCKYTGDDMVRVHTGMNITESHFNRTVDLLVAAMEKVGLNYRQQNLVLRELAPMRGDMLYK